MVSCCSLTSRSRWNSFYSMLTSLFLEFCSNKFFTNLWYLIS